MQYGITIENVNLAIKKSESKKDGIYTFRGFLYRVKNKRLTHLAYYGQILERFGNFNTIVGSYDCYSYNTQHANTKTARKLLQSIE